VTANVGANIEEYIIRSQKVQHEPHIGKLVKASMDVTRRSGHASVELPHVAAG
jgi:hypothetical protein